MKVVISIFIIPSLFLLSSCNHSKDSFAIRDFSEKLQPYLVRVVSNGIVGWDPASIYIQKHATGKELKQLSESEHPVLRALAFREMLNRPTFNHFDLMMHNLDDTAIVATDQGEFGIVSRTVSDDILKEARWKSEEAKKKTIEQVLTKHNYLRSAYLILLEIEPQEKYYLFIKDMATRPRRLSDDGYELDFDDIEYALYGLAHFRKKQDMKIIKEKMMGNVRKLSFISFRLMKDFPDTAYSDIFQSYYRRQFYKSSGHSRNDFTGYYPIDRADPEDFIQALVAQQNERSAVLLDTIVNSMPLQTCMPRREDILREVITEIWNHPCPAYVNLREKIKARAKEILKFELEFNMPIDGHNKLIDTTKETITW